MTGEEAEILCGEWETGATTPHYSGEKYNVILPILEIVRHPDWDTSPGTGGPGAGNDIAVFKVNDDKLRAAENHNIYPSCLPPEITPEITDQNGDQVKVAGKLRITVRIHALVNGHCVCSYGKQTFISG